MLSQIKTENTFYNMLWSEKGQAIAKAVLVELIPKGIQAEAVRRFNTHVENWNETFVDNQTNKIYGGLI